MKITNVEDFFLIRAGNIFLSNEEKLTTVKLIQKKQSQFDWNYILENAEKNYIIPQLYHLIDSTKDEIDIPFSIYKYLEKLYYRSVSFDLAAKYTLKEVSSSFIRNKIKFLLVKGYAIAKYYPHYSHRSYVDIDILIPSRRMFEKASKILIKMGYNLHSVSQPKGESFSHLHFMKDQRFSIELLRELQWGNYRAFIKTASLFSNAIEASVNDYTIFHASPEDSIMINCARLFDTGSFLIRDLVDLSVILKEFNGIFDWDYLLKRAKEEDLIPALLSLLIIFDRVNGNEMIPKRVFYKSKQSLFSRFLFSLLEKTKLNLPLLENTSFSSVILLFAVLQQYKRDLQFLIQRGYQSGFGQEILRFLSDRVREPIGVEFFKKLL